MFAEEKGHLINALSQETQATVQYAFAKAKQAPQNYQLQKASLYRFEHKIQYRLELKGNDGSIWRALISESKTGQQSVDQLVPISEPTVIFKPFAAAKKKRSF